MTGSTLLLLLALVAALPGAAVTGARIAGGGWHSPLPQLAAFAGWAVPAWCLCLGLLVAARGWPALAVLSLIVLHLVWLLPRPADRAARAPRPVAAGAGPPWIDLRVMTVNVLAGRADVAEIVRLAGTGPIGPVDLLTVQESLPALARGVHRGIRRPLRHVVRCQPRSLNGTLIWSRWPLEPFGSAYGAGGQIVPVRLSVPGAVPVTLTAVHTMSPGRGRIRGWRRDLGALERAATATVGAQVLLGDFNATRDHGPFRRLLRTGLADAADAAGQPPWRGLTWPADRREVPALVRLDHVLVTPARVRVLDLRVVPVAGTDHRAVLAHLQLAPVPGG